MRRRPCRISISPDWDRNPDSPHPPARFGPRKKIGPLLWDNLSDISVAHLSAEMDRVGEVHGADNDRQQFVFVGNVEIVDDSKGVVERGISPVCVSIGLKAFNDILSGPGDSLYYSALFGRYKILLAQADRELNPEIGVGM